MQGKIQTTINGCKYSDVTASPDGSGYPVGLGKLRWLGFGVVARLDGTPQTVSLPRLAGQIQAVGRIGYLLKPVIS